MYNDLFSIGPLTIHTYGVMTAVGIVSAYFTADHRANKKGLSEEMRNKVLGLAVFCVVFGYLCSKLLYIITIIPQLASGAMTLADAISNGWVIFGGLLGGILGGLIFCKWQKADFWTYADIAIPAVALAQGFGRIGCFFAGCCYGVETDSTWFYTEFSHSLYAPNGVKLVPTELIMSAGDFLLFAFLLLYEKKWQKAKGELIAVYLMAYSVGRFIVEFWRGDLIRGQVGPLSTSQFIGLFTAAAGLIMFILLRTGKAGSGPEEINNERKTSVPEERSPEAGTAADAQG